MGTRRALLVLDVLVVAAGGVGAQQQVAVARTVARVVAGPELARFDEQLATDTPPGRSAAQRFAEVAKVVVPREPSKTFRVQVANLAGAAGASVLARGSGEEVDAVSAVLDQLRKDEPLRVRLQCSWAIVPKAVAQAQGLKLREVAAADENIVNALLREAAKTKGGLVNLPEVVAAPLAPFAVEPLGKAAAAAETPDRLLRLRGEMLPLADAEVGVAMHLVRGPLPADKTTLPANALVPLAFRLQAGKTAVSMVLTEGDTATVLVVRCIDASPAPLAKGVVR